VCVREVLSTSAEVVNINVVYPVFEIVLVFVRGMLFQAEVVIVAYGMSAANRVNVVAWKSDATKLVADAGDASIIDAFTVPNELPLYA
jgi:hypothetical protein